MNIVTLIPYRAADAARERAWEICRPYYEALGFPIFLGDNDGEFARSAAINAASAAAGKWNVAVIADADTVQEPHAVSRALDLMPETAVVPWQTRWKLSPQGTEKLAKFGYRDIGEDDLDPDDGFAHPSKLMNYPPSRTGSTIVVSRAAWDRAGGFDETFTGWGFEDQAFRVNLGPLVSIPGEIYHCWHEHQPRDGRTKANAARFRAIAARR